MRKYEAVVIYYPTEEEKRQKTMERLNSIITDNGSIEVVDEWGLKKLAYLIDDLSEGYYVVTKFAAEPDVIKEFDRVAKISDSVMRHMIVRIDE